MSILTTIRTTVRARKLARLEQRRQTWLRAAEQHRRDAVELGIRAYYMDQMEQPLAWGRMQNSANWQRHYERAARERAAELEAQIKQLTTAKP